MTENNLPALEWLWHELFKVEGGFGSARRRAARLWANLEASSDTPIILETRAVMLELAQAAEATVVAEKKVDAIMRKIRGE